MNWKSEEILNVLNQCAEDFTFPMLDNGYVYLAATRMSLYRSDDDWAIVIEVFGFSPRSGIPDTQLYTFSSKIHERNEMSNYVTQQAYEDYLKGNPHNEVSFIYPIDNTEWMREDNAEFVGVENYVVRGESYQMPSLEKYEEYGIHLQDDTPQVFEFCRLLAAEKRNSVLATEKERRTRLLPNMKQILQLEEWRHADIVADELPNTVEAFQQLAKVLETGDISQYQPTSSPNTHWINWPDGGTL